MTPQKLKAHRIGLGMTHAIISDRIGITRKTYASYESGASKMPAPIEKLFDIIFAGVEPPKLTAVKKKKTKDELFADRLARHFTPILKGMQEEMTQMRCELEGIKEFMNPEKE